MPPPESMGHTSAAAGNNSNLSGWTKPNFRCCFPGRRERTLRGSTALIGVAAVIVVVGDEDSDVDAVEEDDGSGMGLTGFAGFVSGAEMRSCGQLKDFILWMRTPALRRNTWWFSLLMPNADEAKLLRIPRTRRMSLCTRLDLEFVKVNDISIFFALSAISNPEMWLISEGWASIQSNLSSYLKA